MPGHVAGGEDHGRDRRDEQQLDDPGLGQRDVGADRVAGASVGPAVAVVAGPAAAARRVRRPTPTARPGRRSRRATASAAISAQIDRAEREVERLGPGGELGQDLERRRRPPGREQDGRAERQPDERSGGRAGSARRRRAIATTMSPTTTATQRWRTCAGGRASVSGGTSVPPISGQSGKTSAASVAVTCDPNSSSAKVATAAERREQREPLARAAAADPGRVAARTVR